MSSVSITQALVFEDRNNPIGDIWDGLVKSEELDLQVKSLGNVYTPPVIVNAMVDRAEKSLSGWKFKKILEPACGSGHFVREIYKRMRNSYLGKMGNDEKVIKAHLKTISHIKAIDIDPFAVQTTQLGMFLELYKTPALWQAIAPNGYFDFSKVVTSCDFLDADMLHQNNNYIPDLIIGNPPYGVKVTKETEKMFNVGSNDSYGYFISKSIKILANRGKLLLIVSSTFLTNRRHINLRKQLFEETEIDSIYILHRNAFPSRDVFCCILEFRKNKERLSNHRYCFLDAWPIHPSDPNYCKSLKSWARKNDLNIPSEKLGYYLIPQKLLDIRMMPPHPNKVNDMLGKSKSVSVDQVSLDNNIYPIFSGLPSIFILCSDKKFGNQIRKSKFLFPKVGEIVGYEVERPNTYVSIVKLWQLAQVRQGLATADDPHFLRKSSEVVPNARRRYIIDVDDKLVIKDTKNLSEEEKRNGISVLDPQRTRHFVPYDSGGEANVAKGELRSFWCPIDYWIDWSESAVSLLKKRNRFDSGTPKKPRLNNFNDYFKKGIVGTITGLYAPTYRIGFGGVFGQKANLILPFEPLVSEYLLVILSSKLLRYIAKNFISASVDFSTENIRNLPIVVPSKTNFHKSKEICQRIIKFKKNKIANEEGIDDLIDNFTYQLYNIPKEDQIEIETWFKRRYPHFGKAIQ